MNAEGREEARTLEVLEEIGERKDISQRHLAKKMGIALGLANSYLKRCVRKGWVKVHQIPGNRYLYYLTPKGFAEKSRLTARYLSYSLTFYRKAGDSCLQAFDVCLLNGWQQIALFGASDLAEIALLRSQERDVDIVGLVDLRADRDSFFNRPVWSSVETMGDCQACLITELEQPEKAYQQLCARFDSERVRIPDILDWRPVGLTGS